MTGHSLVPIEYRGTLVALASAERFHVVSPWLCSRPPADPELRFVLYMCLCFAEIAAGRVKGPFSSELAARWARAALIDRDALLLSEPSSDEALATESNVPLEEVRLARAGLARGG